MAIHKRHTHTIRGGGLPKVFDCGQGGGKVSEMCTYTFTDFTKACSNFVRGT